MAAQFSEDDYRRFRAMLRFFVTQAAKNAAAGEVAGPAAYPDASGKFCNYYGVSPELFSFPGGLNYGVHFEFKGHFDTTESTYLNVWNSWVAIMATFAGDGAARHVTALTAGLRADAGFGGYAKPLDDAKKAQEVDEALQSEHGGAAASVRRGEADAQATAGSLDELEDAPVPEAVAFAVADLGLDAGDAEPPTAALRCMLDQQADLYELHQERKLDRRKLERRDERPRERERVAEAEASAERSAD